MKTKEISSNALFSLVLLVISEYAPLNPAWEAESSLASLLNKLNDSEEREYKRLVERLNEFNSHYMYKLTKKHPTHNERTN
jgi:hypothetical protein